MLVGIGERGFPASISQMRRSAIRRRHLRDPSQVIIRRRRLGLVQIRRIIRVARPCVPAHGIRDTLLHRPPQRVIDGVLFNLIRAPATPCPIRVRGLGRNHPPQAIIILTHPRARIIILARAVINPHQESIAQGVKVDPIKVKILGGGISERVPRPHHLTRAPYRVITHQRRRVHTIAVIRALDLAP